MNHLALIEVIEQPSPAVSVELAAAISQRRADRRPYTGVSMPAGTLELLYIRAARRNVMLGVVPAQRSPNEHAVTTGARFRKPRSPGDSQRSLLGLWFDSP